MTDKKKYPQRAPKKNYFAELAKTEEGRELRKAWSNKPRKNAGRPSGVPHGHTKDSIAPLRVKAKEEAKRVVKYMEDNGEKFEDQYAKEAMESAVEIMRTEGGTRDRLAAARLVLDFTKQKPVTKSDVTVGKAEDFLAGLLAEEEHGQTTETGEKETLQ
tara:strand:- start:8345 stop:8821 length:477 start_codon:yes stop_codon:yes gene_type:complete